MKTLTLSGLCCLVLAGCATYDDINFERMSEVELVEYNQGRPLGQQIVCSDETNTMSRVRRRRCATVEQMYGSVESAEQLGVLNSAPRL